MNTVDTRPARERGLGGQVLIIFTLMLTVLLIAVGFGVDFAGYYSKKTQAEHAVQAARDAVVSQVPVIKFSDDPADVICKTMAQALADNGFEGTATMVFYELPRDYATTSGKTVGRSHRIEGVHLMLEGTYKTNIIGMAGVGELVARAQGAWSLDLYSKSDAVWSPSADGAGFGRKRVYTVSATGASMTGNEGVSKLDSANVPQSLRDAVNQAADNVAR